MINVPGQKTGKSLLIEDGALTWLVANAATEVSPVRRHIELALCHLAQHGITFVLCNFFRYGFSEEHPISQKENLD